MRLLIILLIAANCATYFWLQTAHSSTRAPSVSPAFEAAPQIVLLHEQSAEIADSGSQVEPKEPELPMQVSAPDRVAKADVPASVKGDAETTHVNSHGNSENPASQVAIRSALPQNFEDGDLCWFVDLADEQDATLAAQRQQQLDAISNYFYSLGVQSELVSVEVVKVSKHVIYLPARETYKQALTDLKALLKEGYDAFVFREGEFRNAISLGFYSNKNLAEEMREKFQQKGLDAQLSPWRTHSVDPMLRVDDRNTEGLTELWGSMESQWQGARREKKYCNSVVAQG